MNTNKKVWAERNDEGITKEDVAIATRVKAEEGRIESETTARHEQAEKRKRGGRPKVNKVSDTTTEPSTELQGGSK